MVSVTVHLVAAARPNIMKVAPLYHAMMATDWCDVKIIHTGQHYDVNMSDVFFRDFGLPEPDFHLGVGSGSHAEQTGGVMIAYEKACMQNRPDWIVVVGDVNATVAVTLVASKLHIPVAHLEAGLRSGDRNMPEEINRLVTDAIADLLWTPSLDASENLRNEGVAEERIDFVGNIMIDSYELLKSKISALDMPARLGIDEGEYGVVTLHRPSNVDSRETLSALVNQLRSTANQLQLVFAVHPRTRKQLHAFGLFNQLTNTAGINVLEPLSYIEFMNLVTSCKMVITDSGGIQEETTYLGIPCLTCRTTTERPITVTQGTNRLISVSEISSRVSQILTDGAKESICPDLWDGRTASRCVQSIKSRIQETESVRSIE